MTRPQTERHPQGKAMASDYFQLGNARSLRNR
jgi:YD repeat-containing protein